MRLTQRGRRLHASALAETSPTERAELLALHETTLALLDRQDPQSLLETIVDRAGGLVGTEHGYLYLLEPGDPELRVHVATGIFRDFLGFRRAIGCSRRWRAACARTSEPRMLLHGSEATSSRF